MNPKMNRGNPTQVLNRVLRYMLRYYKFKFVNHFSQKC